MADAPKPSDVEASDDETPDEDILKRMQELDLAGLESPEDMLEKRIEEVERKIYGIEGAPKEDVVLESTIIDRLEQVNTIMTTALSGRENINALIQRLPEIEEILDGKYETTEVEYQAKLEYILAMEPEIKKLGELSKKFNELLPVLDSDRFDDLPDRIKELNALKLDYVKLNEQANQVTQETRSFVSRYSDIITNISKSLVTLDREVTQLEENSKIEKVTD